MGWLRKDPRESWGEYALVLVMFLVIAWFVLVNAANGFRGTPDPVCGPGYHAADQGSKVESFPGCAPDATPLP